MHKCTLIPMIILFTLFANLWHPISLVIRIFFCFFFSFENYLIGFRWNCAYKNAESVVFLRKCCAEWNHGFAKLGWFITNISISTDSYEIRKCIFFFIWISNYAFVRGRSENALGRCSVSTAQVPMKLRTFIPNY